MSYSYNAGMASRTDVLKMSSAFITQRLFQGKPLDEKLWIVSSALVIIGFIAYQLLIASWLDTSKIASGSAKVAIDDILKFSTMFVVSRVLSGTATGEKQLSQEEWVKDSGLFIASLVTYDLLLHDLVTEKTAHLDKTQQLVIADVVKMTFVFSAHNFAKGGEFDKEWMLTSAGFITGFVIYDVVVQKFLGGYIEKGTLDVQLPKLM
jgi:hypothetical protein